MNDLLTPLYPDLLQQVDVARVSFYLDFVTPCVVSPTVFLSMGRALRLASRPFLDHGDPVAGSQWKKLFQPAVSVDPVARRKFQKPAPAYVVTMPVDGQKRFVASDRLEIEVLFIGTGIPLIHVFLRSLSHLGQLGLVGGEGRFEVVEAVCPNEDGQPFTAWCQPQPFETFEAVLQPVSWLLNTGQISDSARLRFSTPTRLMVDAKPLRRPAFREVFPFMLRRVTSMLHAHAGFEIIDQPERMLAAAEQLQQPESSFRWADWREVGRSKSPALGGFVGEMLLVGESLADLYWLLSTAGLFGIGKSAAYGAGKFSIEF